MLMPMRRLAVPTLGLLAALAAGAGPAAAQQRPSAAELREASRELFESQIARDGRLTDPARNASVRKIMERLKDAAAQPGLTITWAIVNNDTVNAWATPGGYVVVFRGLMDFADSVARLESPNDPELARRRSAAFLAGVLAHELSHVTLQHGGDPRISACMARMRSTGAVTANQNQQAGEAEGRLIRSAVDCMSYSQSQETAADRLGAMYMLRQNWRGETDWTIQAMIDFFRFMDGLHRNTSHAQSPFLTSYLASHPRATTRMAQLEILRGQLKLDQTRFDDALSLIANNMELDLAIGLLDSVLVNFPDLTAAKAARAAALQRKYLNTIPVQMLQVRASVPTLRAMFIDNIRGEVLGDQSLRAEARRAFEAVLAVERSPVTLSNIAILDAYGGDLVAAETQARQALAGEPQNPELMNNLGVVLYLRGQYAAARDQFQASLNIQGDSAVGWVALPVFFNLGRSLLALDDPRGKALLERYLTYDENSEWSKEARRLLGRETTTTTTTETRPKPKTDINFGMSTGQIIEAWGQPESTERTREGVILMRYPNGMQLVVHPEKGLAGFILLTREAGQVEGVRVGDPITSLTAKARPAEIRDDLYFFTGQGVVVIAKVREGIIVQLAMLVTDS